MISWQWGNHPNISQEHAIFPLKVLARLGPLVRGCFEASGSLQSQTRQLCTRGDPGRGNGGKPRVLIGQLLVRLSICLFVYICIDDYII